MLRWMDGDGDPLKVSDCEEAGWGKHWLGCKISIVTGSLLFPSTWI